MKKNNIPVGTTIKYIGLNLWIASYNSFSSVGDSPDSAIQALNAHIVGYNRKIILARKKL